MKDKVKRIISVFMCLCMIFSFCSISSFAKTGSAEKQEISYTASNKGALANELAFFASADPSSFLDSMLSGLTKAMYNLLNIFAEKIVEAICNAYPDPSDWGGTDDIDSEFFLPGRESYQTSAAEGNYWTLGYASKSILPDDVTSGSYYIGRDLTNRKAIGVYDDQRIRVSVIDDNSGEGAIVLGVIDALGVTSTDVRSIRKGVLEYCQSNSINVASVNITSTHAHSVLDTQGVSTEFFYKLAGNFINNKYQIFDELPFLEAPTYFKNFFISQSIEAVEEAFKNQESGKMYFGETDASNFIKDKRGLIAKEDIPKIATLYFAPSNGGAATFISDISCHPTSFEANNLYVGSDYIYYLDQYIKEKTGANFMMVQGAVGQLSRDNIDVDTSDMSEYEAMGAVTKKLGETFGQIIIDGDYSQELQPIINAKHREVFLSPENSVLILACETKLVNNKVYRTGEGVRDVIMASEIGYLEFGHKIGFAMFPGELYPEVFWGTDITNNTNWDGTQWQYGSLKDSVDGISVYAISLANDATGYVLTDNNFAFMGHIIGDGIADEVLSAGKHTGSYLIGEYYNLIKEFE